MASQQHRYICSETQQRGRRPSRWFTFTSGGACLLFLLTFEGEEDSWQRLREAGGPAGDQTESQEEECHSRHQRRPGRPLRPAHDCTGSGTTTGHRCLLERGISERRKTFASSSIGKTLNLFCTVFPTNCHSC